MNRGAHIHLAAELHRGKRQSAHDDVNGSSSVKMASTSMPSDLPALIYYARHEGWIVTARVGRMIKIFLNGQEVIRNFSFPFRVSSNNLGVG